MLTDQLNPRMEFVQTNVIGTVNLLQCANKYWRNNEAHVFHHVSTDEVYGSLGKYWVLY